MRSTHVAASLALALAVSLSTATARAHHSVIAEFDLQTAVTLRGTITQMEWVNPHGWIQIDVTGADGRIQTWKGETGSPFQLKKRGLSVTDFTTGTEVIVAGFAAKNGTPTAAGWVITFVDRQASLDDEGAEVREASFALGR